MSQLKDVQRVFEEFADGTTMHGVPRIINARSIPARIFWTVLCISAFVMFFWQSAILLHRFYSYPKKVNVEIIQRPVPFPMVSVCNTDPLDVEVAYYLEKAMLRKMHKTKDPLPVPPHLLEFQNRYSEFWNYSKKYFETYLDIIGQSHSIEKARKDLTDIYSILGLTANIGPELASDAGVKLHDFVVRSKFLTEDSNISLAFTKYFDPYYFNCFTFHPEAILPSRATRFQGVRYGLSLLLFTGSGAEIRVEQDIQDFPDIQSSDSNSVLASGRGARVVVHSPDTVPHPTAEGYDIPSGFSVSIGVKAKENVRIKPPHGNCSDETGTKFKEKNGSFKGTLISCQNDCIQKNIMEICGCIDNRFLVPKHMDGLDYCFKLPSLPDSCLSLHSSNQKLSAECRSKIETWSSKLNCLKIVYENMTIKDPEAMDRCRCKPPCNDIVYDTSYSLSTLPERSEEHTAFYIDIDKFMESEFPESKKNIFETKHGEAIRNLTLRNIARINVHIADANIYKRTESADYEAIRLISDIGGQLGLWIGISVMTIFEVIQLVVDIIHFLTSKIRKRDVL